MALGLCVKVRDDPRGAGGLSAHLTSPLLSAVAMKVLKQDGHCLGRLILFKKSFQNTLGLLAYQNSSKYFRVRIRKLTKVTAEVHNQEPSLAETSARRSVTRR